MNNPNLMHNISANFNLGNLRETFFFNQVQYMYTVFFSSTADFKVNGIYEFELGGRNKKQKQIEGLPNSLIVKDGIEIGSSTTIPLWLFGFLY